MRELRGKRGESRRVRTPRLVLTSKCAQEARRGRRPDADQEGSFAMLRILRLIPLLAFVALVAASCASRNQVVSEWKDPAYSVRGGQKVVVMATAENEISGRIWETEMTK